VLRLSVPILRLSISYIYNLYIYKLYIYNLYIYINSRFYIYI